MSKVIRQLRIEDWVLVIIAGLILGTIIVKLVFAQVSNPYSDWRYKVRIDVINPTTATKYDYPVRMEIPVKPYIQAGRMKSDLGDIRFSKGNAKLPFWIQITEGMRRSLSNTVIYVRLNELIPGTNTIYMYFDINKDENSEPIPAGGESYFCNNLGPNVTLGCDSYNSCNNVSNPWYPFGGKDAAASVFGKTAFAYDSRDTDTWSKIGNFRTKNEKWISKKLFSNNKLINFRTMSNNQEMMVYFLTQDSSVSNLINSKGYRFFIDYNSSAPSGNYHTGRLLYYLRIQRQDTTGGGWSDIGSFSTYFYPTVSEWEINVETSTIGVWINGDLKASVPRTDTFNGGYVGFDRMDWVGGCEWCSNTTDSVGPTHIIDGFLGSHSKIEIIGNPDLELKKIRPTPVFPEDPNYFGKNLIEYPPAKQRREGYVDGNTLDKYIYRAYQMANKDQTFEYSVRIWNRGDFPDTFVLYITGQDGKELDLLDWNLAYRYTNNYNYEVSDTDPIHYNLPGGTSTLMGTVTNIPAYGYWSMRIIAVPGEATLFNGGKLDFMFKVEGGMDMCLDTARFVSNVKPRLKCNWKKRIPITISYYDKYNTGDLLDYQVLINTGDISCLKEARDDGSDVIFTDKDGGFIPFWMKSWSKDSLGNKKGSFWIKVPRINSICTVIPGSPGLYFGWGIFSDETMRLDNSDVDSYDSLPYSYSCTCGGDIRSNQGINLGPNTEICGDAMPGPGYSVKGGSVNCTITPATSTITLPPIPPFAVGNTNISLTGNNTKTINPGKYGNIEVSGNAKLTLNTGTYYINSLKTSGNGQVIINQEVKLYIKTDFKISGNGINNTTGDPTELLIFYSGTERVEFSGNANLYGALYAPNAEVEHSGNGEIYGSVIAKKITGSGNAKIHYYTPLGNVEISPPTPPSTAPQTATTTIWMYFGNPDYAISKSNKKETFDLWEDWEQRPLNDVVGCPDIPNPTGNCSGKPDDPNGWQNFAPPDDLYNWWRIKADIRGKALMSDITVPPGGAAVGEGPYLSGGDVRWKNYELVYMGLSKVREQAGSIVYYDDEGNWWQMEMAGNFSFQPTTYGIDWLSKYKSNAEAIIGEAFLPKDDPFWIKVRVFTNPINNNTYLTTLYNKDDNPSDIDSDTGFNVLTYNTGISGEPFGLKLEAEYYSRIKGGKIGFYGHWYGQGYYDEIRVRKCVQPEPTYTMGSCEDVAYRPIQSLSFPNITQPLMNGRPCLLLSSLKPWSWRGDLFAYYADCYLGGNCQKNESQTKTYTISLWGKDGTTPRGFGSHLKEAQAKDNNPSTIQTPDNWKTIGRKIYTVYNGNLLDFNIDKKNILINLLFKPDDIGSPTEVENLIRFVRGQYIAEYPRSKVRVEDDPKIPGTTSDKEQWKLGDIIHSNPIAVGIPVMTYDDWEYGSFTRKYNKRELVAYFGSNDGMIHCVRLARWGTDTDDGKARYIEDKNATELWAFIPNGLLGRLKETTDGDHEYTMDGSLRVVDIKDDTYPDKYKTVLIGTLRTGGQSIFALDITDPGTPTLMWEINEKTNPAEFDKIGKSFSQPALGRLIEGNTNTDRWVGIFGSGLHPDNTINLFSKTAYLTIVNLKTGEIIKQIEVSSKIGNITSSIALLKGFFGEIKKIYFGDYCGAVWSIDLTTKDKVNTFLTKTILTKSDDLLFMPPDYGAISKIIDTPPKRPVPSQPVASCSDIKDELFMVYFATGDYDLHDSNYPHQRIYGLKEWARPLAGYYQDSDSPLNLKDMTCSDDTDKKSFFIELGHNPGDTGYIGCTNMHDYATTGAVSTKDNNERCLSTPEVFSGYLFFTTFTPSKNICEWGLTRLYSVGFETGAYQENLIQAVSGKQDVRSVCYVNVGVPSSSMIYFVRGKVVGGVINTGTGDIINVEMDEEQFLKYINIILWREKR